MTADCPRPTDGPGDSPNNAVAIEDFFDLLGSAVTWATPEQGRRENEWAIENEIPVTPDLHCKWVTVSGHFRRDNYQGYRGILTETARSLYTEDMGPGDKIRERRYVVENWADPETRSALINGAYIRITALFYDLCRVAYREREEAGDGRIIMSGPCHYGRFTGLMLRDAKIDAVLSAPFQRVRGEENRTVIGNIREIDPSWPELGMLKAAAISKINLLREGPSIYWRRTLEEIMRPSDYLDESVAKRANDPDDWFSFLSLHPESPLHESKRPIEKNEFKVYRLSYYGGGESETQINIAIACFCTKRTCGDVWPLFWEDATDFHSDYLCFDFHRGYQDKSKWR